MKKTTDGAARPRPRSPRNGALNRLVSTFTLVSRIPVGRPVSFDPTRMDFWLPVVGLSVSILAGGLLYALSSTAIPPSFVALAVLAVQYFSFNLFHLDGLLDTADAFLGSGDAEKRLAILKDSRIGVYAFFSGFLYLAAKWELLSFLVSATRAIAGAGGAALAVAGILAYPIAGRTAGALVPAFLPPARGDGLGILAEGSEARRTLIGCAAALAALAAIGGVVALLQGNRAEPISLVAVAPLWLAVPASAAVVATAVARAYRRGVGGYTGDALGAAVELAELGHLALSLWLLTLLA